MAERRMFAKTIIDSDAFLEMPVTSQLLYFHLCMRADDEGFINKPKSIMRLIGCKDDDIRVLLSKKFIIPFESGIVVIKHWKIHNYIRGDRLHETKYLEEKSQLEVTENQAYTLCQSNDGQLVDTLDTEVRLGKVRLGKVSIESNNDASKEAPERHKYGEYRNVLLSDDEIEKLKSEFNDYEVRIERLSSYIASTGKHYKSHLATIRNWARRDNERPQEKVVIKKNNFNNVSQRTYDMSDLEKKLLNR